MKAIGAAVAMLLLTVSEWAHAEPRIVWEVENPFRFFLDPADTEVHRATWVSLPAEQRANPVLSAERVLAERHPEGWAATMFDKTCWDDERNRYACKDRPDYINPKSHVVRASLQGLDDAQTVDCQWLTAPRGKSGGRGKAVTLPCDIPVQLELPYPGGAWIKVEVGGQQVAEVAAEVQDLFIVGMGDSFASGEGNPDVPVRFSPDRTAEYGTAGNIVLNGYPARIGAWKTIGEKAFLQENARWLDQACHRSLYSHQLRAALQIAVEDPHRAVTYVGVACSGAETVAGLFLRYKGHEWVPNPPQLSQISAVAQAQCGGREPRAYDLPEAYHMNEQIPELKGGLVLRKCEPSHARKIDLLFLSIGGNDIGFARLVANAVLADTSALRRLGGWFGQVHGFAEASSQMDVLDDRLKAVNRAAHYILHVPWPESDRIVLTGYPPMALLEDGSSVCPDSHAGMNVLPDFFLSEAKAREGNTAAERLNAVMEDSARQLNWSFVDAHREAFRGRGLCSAYAVGAWTIPDEMRIPRKVTGVWEPYNPSDWRAYASRLRWFRTPNDAFMTGNFHVSESLLQKALKTQSLSWMQVLLAAVYSGAFHPTAEGQAAIADAVVDKARGVITKYETRRRAATQLR